jgi:hypothetical protein
VTVRAFVDALADVPFADIKRRYPYPPAQISTADLPALYVRPPSLDYDPQSTCDDTADNMVCAIVVAVEATGQNTQPANYDKLIKAMDDLNAGLKAHQNEIGALTNWRIAAQDIEPIIVSQTAFWGVTATVTKRG